MGYSGKLEDKIKAQELRLQGLSYNEILTHVSVSKGTLSSWCKDIVLTKDQKRKLQESKYLGQKKGSIIAADNKRNARLLRTKKIQTESKKEVGEIFTRDKFMLGIALYAAEGDKTDGNIGFTNADSRLIKFMMQWFITYCQIPLDKFRGAIWIHEGRDATVAKEYWSSITGIPKEQFHKTYIAKNKTDSKKIRKNINEHGVFAIRCSNSPIHRKIMGWISAIFGGKIVRHSVIAQR